MAASTTLLRQHLIDPDICIRCNTCEEACKPKAITHDRRNYVVDASKCNACGDCLPPCPTGAIDTWRDVRTAFTLEEQFSWDALPAVVEATAAGPSDVPDEVLRLVNEASRAEGGRVPPPWSAAHPYIGLYGRERPAVATVVGTYRLTSSDADVDIRHIVLDLGKCALPLLEGQSIGILPPGNDSLGRPHHVRLYSVASPRNGERPNHNNFAITVKRVTSDHEGRPVRGIASNYLCDLERGAHVQITGPYGSSFLMPNHPGAKLLMVCTGTGAAPMRAMTERRRRRLGLNEGGRMMLFFGARRPEELPYCGPLSKLPSELIDVELAYSRVPDQPKAYVQDRIRARADVVAEWLKDDDVYVYVCGHKRMEQGVLDAFAEIATGAGMDWPLRRDEMLRTGRLHIETY
jgi:benzoyl-CoA 2,3-dioxygenase component A